jgi:hypothetical protein
MMRGRALRVAAAWAVVLAIGPQAAAGDVLHQGIGRCEADATWQLSSDATGNWSATMSYATPPTTGCKQIHARIEDDLDPTVTQWDYGQSSPGIRFNLVGGSVSANFAFAGVARRDDNPEEGPLVIADGLLNATIAFEPTLYRAVHVHRGLGSCGVGCFKTRMTWAATAGSVVP